MCGNQIQGLEECRCCTPLPPWLAMVRIELHKNRPFACNITTTEEGGSGTEPAYCESSGLQCSGTACCNRVGTLLVVKVRRRIHLVYTLKSIVGSSKSPNKFTMHIFSVRFLNCNKNSSYLTALLSHCFSHSSQQY